MEVYIYLFLYVIIEAMIIWIWEWRERVRGERNVFKKTRTISWLKRRLLKMKDRRRHRIRKSEQLALQRRILASYLRYLQQIKLDETVAQERLSNKNELNHDLVTTRECLIPPDSSKSSTSETVITSSDLDFGKSDSILTDNLTRDVTQDEPVAGEINDSDSLIDDVKETIDNMLSIVCETCEIQDIRNKDSATNDVTATIDNIPSIICETSEKAEIVKRHSVTDDVIATIDKILSVVCETSSTEEIMKKVTDDVKTTIDYIVSIVCETCDETTADKTNADNIYPKVEEMIKKVDADETVNVDDKSQPKVITPEPINRPFLYDSELYAANIVSKPLGPRRLIQWNGFDDVNVDDDVLSGKDGQFWDCEDMFEYNEIHFGYKFSLDKDLSEYTTPLIREDTEEDRLRWERACRLAYEIKTKRLGDQATQVSKKKKRNKKANKANSYKVAT